ncbi:MAG: sugar phosphate isomerase/epimerase, partial [Candidatus Hydrogenedentes bacterium]|nr:sugar phosphate isomerase/epimerase [Candidatus Hydrogenedentota bacterium]
MTFRRLSPLEIVKLMVQAEVSVVEWGGDVHVPHGDTNKAREVLAMCRNEGIRPVSYGSYYRVGCRGGDNPSFNQVLDTAAALEVQTIRVWAG